MQAAVRRHQRTAKQRQRELETQAKELAKLNALEQAQLEVEQFHNRLDLLVSIHKEEPEQIDWFKLASALPPGVPLIEYCEFSARLRQTVLRLCGSGIIADQIEHARTQDQKATEAANTKGAAAKTECLQTRDKALAVLSGDHKAYTNALVEMGSFSEIAELGSSIHFAVHSRTTVECSLKVNGTKAIPSEQKALSASGKLLTKALPRLRFQEIYHDYVCSCILRVGREVFALLPVKVLLITATADVAELGGTMANDMPILSTVLRREALAALDYDQIDPSDTMESFQHRGDLSKARKGQEFARVVPLEAADVQIPVETMDLSTLFSAVRECRTEVEGRYAELNRGLKTLPLKEIEI
jgi:hypothetical protein